MAHPHEPSPARPRRLSEELAEIGFTFDGQGHSEAWAEMVLIELDYALRPAVHERRVPLDAGLFQLDRLSSGK